LWFSLALKENLACRDNSTSCPYVSFFSKPAETSFFPRKYVTQSRAYCYDAVDDFPRNSKLKEKAMQIIGAGLPRTGTMSLQVALNRLQYPCYHMETLIRRPSHIEHWHKLLIGKAAMDWHSLFRNFEAAVDAPACFYVQEILHTYPDAKVILTVRDAEAWYASLLTLRRAIESIRWMRRFIPRLMRVARYNQHLLKRFGFDPFISSKEEIIQSFHAHNAVVQQEIAKERLLVFQVKDGWEPLCTFLGCAVPQGVPFPHLNAGASTIKRKAGILLVAQLAPIFVAVALLIALVRLC
jgi:hypothetical protein